MKVIADTPYFDLIQIDDKHGLHVKQTSVAVLPYTVNDSGIVDQLGILKELNHLREGDYAYTLITGTIEDSDESVLATAVRELAEEGGITASSDDLNRWVFLGNFHDSKDTDRTIPTFAVDVTGLPQIEPATDGSHQELNSVLELKDVNEVLTSSKETLVLASFLRLFNIMYQKSFKNAK